MERLLVPALPRNSAVAVACASISIVLLSAVLGCKHSYGPDVVATVNGEPIQRSEVEKLYRENLGNNKEATHQGAGRGHAAGHFEAID